MHQFVSKGTGDQEVIVDWIRRVKQCHLHIIRAFIKAVLPVIAFTAFCSTVVHLDRRQFKLARHTVMQASAWAIV